MREGLAGKAKRPDVEYIETPDTGQGVVAAVDIHKGEYVCEYKTSSVYPAREKEKHSREHDLNNAGSYVIETAYRVPEGGGQLMFDATERYHHPGRYINHVARGGNLKLMGPFYIREKWRIGFLAIRGIKAGEELCYDYGDRTEEWMRKARLVKGRVTADGKGIGESKESGELEGDGEEEDAEEVGGEEKKQDEMSKRKPKARKPAKRRYVYCPIQGCPSGPVQKVTQHLQNVHKLSRANIRRLTVTKRYAPPEAVKNRTPNPHPSRKQLTLEQSIISKSRASREVVVVSPVKKKETKKKPTTDSGRECVPSTSGIGTTRHMRFHSDHPFIDDFASHLKSTAGGARSDDAVKQIIKITGKYLWFLNNSTVCPRLLLRKKSLLDYVKKVEEHGVGNSGVLQQLDAITLAVKFLRIHGLEEEDDGEIEQKVPGVLAAINDMRKSYKSRKTSRERERLEDLAANLPDIADATKFLQHEELTALFYENAKKLTNNPDSVKRGDYYDCLSVVAGRLLYR